MVSPYRIDQRFQEPRPRVSGIGRPRPHDPLSIPIRCLHWGRRTPPPPRKTPATHRSPGHHAFTQRRRTPGSSATAAGLPCCSSASCPCSGDAAASWGTTGATAEVATRWDLECILRDNFLTQCFIGESVCGHSHKKTLFNHLNSVNEKRKGYLLIQ